MTRLEAWQPLSLLLFELFWIYWLVLWAATHRAFRSFANAVSVCLAVLIVGINADDIQSALWMNARLSAGDSLQAGLNVLTLVHETGVAIQLILSIACFCVIRAGLLLCQPLARRVFGAAKLSAHQRLPEKADN